MLERGELQAGLRAPNRFLGSKPVTGLDANRCRTVATTRYAVGLPGRALGESHFLAPRMEEQIRSFTRLSSLGRPSLSIMSPSCPSSSRGPRGTDIPRGTSIAETSDRRSFLARALDDVVDLEHLGLGCELDPDVVEHRHQALLERIELLPGVPDLVDAEVSIRPEGDVVLESLRHPVAGLLQPPDGFVVLFRRHLGRGGKANERPCLAILHALGRGLRTDGGH